MSTVYRMAWRNLGRNAKRSRVTGLGLALALALCMATLALMDGLSQELIQGTTEGEVGHIQIHEPHYLDSRALRRSVSADAQALAALRSAEGVQGVSARLYAFAYLSHGSRSSGVQLLGIDPEQEAAVTVLHRKRSSGEWLSAEATPWRQAQALSEAQQAADQALTEAAIAEAFARLEGRASSTATPTPAPSPTATSGADASLALAEQLAPGPSRRPGVVLGAKLAANLGLSADPEGRWGQVLELLVEGAHGVQSHLELEVRGVLQTGLDHQDRSRLLLHLSDLQHMLQLPDQAHEIALRLTDPGQADARAAALQAQLGEGQQVQSWSQLRPDVLALIAANRALMGTLVFIVFLIAGVGVLNTMLVSVMERQRELSLLKALGLPPSKVLLLVMAETVLLCLAGGLVGLTAGAALVGWLQVHGLDVSRFGEFSLSGVGMAPVLRAQLSAAGAALPLAMLVLISVVSALVPALWAARLAPAAGMRAQ